MNQRATIITAKAVLGTLWVYLAVGEQAPPLTLVGSAVVIAGLALNAWIAMRRRRQVRVPRPWAPASAKVR